MGLYVRKPANNRGADQPLQLLSLISTFVICFLESIMTPLARPKCSIFWVFSVAELYLVTNPGDIEETGGSMVAQWLGTCLWC